MSTYQVTTSALAPTNETKAQSGLRFPSAELTHKWQLATTDNWSHIICMPGKTKQQIDLFADDLAAALAAKSL